MLSALKDLSKANKHDYGYISVLYEDGIRATNMNPGEISPRSLDCPVTWECCHCIQTLNEIFCIWRGFIWSHSDTRWNDCIVYTFSVNVALGRQIAKFEADQVNLRSFLGHVVIVIPSTETWNRWSEAEYKNDTPCCIVNDAG